MCCSAMCMIQVQAQSPSHWRKLWCCGLLYSLSHTLSSLSLSREREREFIERKRNHSTDFLCCLSISHVVQRLTSGVLTRQTLAHPRELSLQSPKNLSSEHQKFRINFKCIWIFCSFLSYCLFVFFLLIADSFPAPTPILIWFSEQLGNPLRMPKKKVRLVKANCRCRHSITLQALTQGTIYHFNIWGCSCKILDFW